MFPLDGDERSAGTALTLVERPDGLEDRYGHVVDIDRRGRVRVGGTLLGRLRPPPLADVKSVLAAVSEHARTSLSTDNDEHAPADLLLAVAPRSYDEEHHNALRPTLARHEVCGVTDAELVEGLKTLDDEAYRSVIECYGKPLYGYIYSLTADHDLSEDILSETYLRMVEKIDTYTYYGAPFKAWLYRIAHNLAMTTLKRGSRVMGSDALEKVARPVTDVALRVEVRLEHEAVRMALGELTEEQQQVLLLRFVAELSPPEIAQAMEKSEVAVRQMQFRALRSLGRLLEQQA
jgi:RNA polymerase sigma-70 factor (ECF subfamily)